MPLRETVSHSRAEMSGPAVSKDIAGIWGKLRTGLQHLAPGPREQWEAAPSWSFNSARRRSSQTSDALADAAPITRTMATPGGECDKGTTLSGSDSAFQDMALKPWRCRHPRFIAHIQTIEHLQTGYYQTIMSQWETSSRLVKLVKQVNCWAVNGNQFATICSVLLNEIWCPLTTQVFRLYLGLFRSQPTGTPYVGLWKQL